ncbi:MAG: CHAT domain-containing protein [Bacillota bacterium]
MFESAVFGNRAGSHHLIESSLPASAPVLDALRFLVDRPAGHVGPEVRWFPYWGCQRIDQWWVLWRGEEDVNAPRKNMVVARVALVPVDACASVGDLDILLFAVGSSAADLSNPDLSLAGAIVDCLSRGEGPAVVPDLALAPNLLRALWLHLWASARASLSLRTLFGAEGLDSVSASSIVVVPAELKPRWHGRKLMEQSSGNPGAAAQWFTGNASPRLTRVIDENIDRLPGDYAVLERVARVVERLDRLEAGTGTPSDALVVIRTQEAFTGGLVLSSDDINLVGSAFTRLNEMSVGEIRAASLARLDLFSDLADIENALSQWIEVHLPAQSVADALWILEQAIGESHAPWWRRAVGAGVRAACRRKSREWAEAIWNWWQARPDSVALLANYIENSSASERWLAACAPSNAGDALLDAITVMCQEREWQILLTSALGSTRPLIDCVKRLRSTLSHPEAGVDVLLAERDALEVIDAAAATWWLPIVDRAVKYTVARPALLARTLLGDPVPLVSRHLSQGGAFPVELVRDDFLGRVFEGATKARTNEDCLNIMRHLDRRAGRILLDHPKADDLFRVNAEVAHGGVEEWWRRFLASDTTGRPPPSLAAEALQFARAQTRNQPVTLVIGLLRLFSEITEGDFEGWMKHTGFLWESGDHERMAEILLSRRWSSATRTFRWSWKHELKLVAWHARGLLSWFDQFWSAPEGANQLARKDSTHMRNKQVKVLFLAANPSSSSRLALDEEARAIEEKVRDAKHRDLIAVRTRWAVQPEDLQQALLEDEPTVVHFSGHGGGAVGIVLHATDLSEERLVTADVLADLFRVLKDGIRVVVLNACCSDVQAQAIVKEIDFVIGMSDSIGDEAARVFAAAFYRGLAFGRSVRTAFELGINELKLVGLGEDDAIPRLLVRSGVDPEARLVNCHGDAD